MDRSNLEKLQKVQNTPARLIVQRKRESISANIKVKVKSRFSNHLQNTVASIQECELYQFKEY